MTSVHLLQAESGHETGTNDHRRLDLFPVPVFRWRWPEAYARKAALVEAIRRRRELDPGVVKSNRQGWHSETDLPTWSDQATEALVRWCAGRVEAATLSLPGNTPPAPLPPWRMTAWANVNPPGGAHNISHTHAQKNWHWSACYYVDVPSSDGGEDCGGALILEDRGSGLDFSSTGGGKRTYRIIPEEGELIIFPAWLHHRVEEHGGAGDRITIAFNLHNPALERARLWEYRPRWWWRRFPGLMRRVATARGKPDLSLHAIPAGWDVQT